MKLLELIDEYIDLKIAGYPQSAGWQSIYSVASAERQYWERLQELRDLIDISVNKENT